jgi:hypothetical protein
MILIMFFEHFIGLVSIVDQSYSILTYSDYIFVWVDDSERDGPSFWQQEHLMLTIQLDCYMMVSSCN